MAVFGVVYTISAAAFVTVEGPVLVMDMATTAWFAAHLTFFGLLTAHNGMKL